MKPNLILLTVLLAALSAFSAEYYVDASRPDDSGAATNWATAKQTIQAAVDLTVDSDIIWVTNGVYDAGGKVTPGYSLTNRVCITTAITVCSVNGPEVTIIKGAAGSNGSNDVNSIRGVFMKNSCSLTGFTVTNGYTMGDSGDLAFDCSGGGLWMATNCIASNCMVSGSSASNLGGGAYLYYGGILNNCTLNGNDAYRGGGAYLAVCGTLNNCTLVGNSASADGGGVLLNLGGALNNCTLVGNSASADGGGAYLIWGGTLNNCLLRGNQAGWSGGGAYLNSGGTLDNCTLTGNSAELGGGVFLHDNATLNNSIVWDNAALFDGMDIFSTGSGNAARYTCASDGVTNGIDGCITSDPLFVDGANSNFQLQASSPCINAGNNTYAPTNITPYDLAGNPRVFGTTVDMGAYERVPKYIITTTVGVNGSITPGNPAVIQSQNQTFSIQPAAGYHIASLTVDGNLVPVASSYTFTNVQSAHTIAASFTVDMLTQTISFDSLPNKRVDDAPFSLNATASSGLPVNYTSSNPAVATVSGNIVTITGIGITTITASQAGNTIYLPTSMGQTLRVLAVPGIVLAWGYNRSGQTTIPVGLSSVAAIDAGGHSTVALKSNGAVIMWGEQSSVPVGLSNVTAISRGVYHTVALKNDGTIVAWGTSSYGQTAVPVGLSNVMAIAAGGYHTMVLKNDGTVVVWSRNDHGQSTVPTGLSNVVAIAAGSSHNVALKSDGTVTAWGWNDNGQSTVPVGLSNVTAIAAGDYHSVALKSDGTVTAWGGATVPVGLSNVTAIAAGRYQSVALKSDGTVTAWGNNNYGEATVPSGLSNVTAIAAGQYHTVALVFGVPLTLDLDSNGLPDSWEHQYYGWSTNVDPSAFCSNGVNTILQAYIAGIDPKNPQSNFQTSGFCPQTSGNELRWQGVSGRVYSVYYSTNLLNGFQPLETNIPWTAGAFTDTVHQADESGFYKIHVKLAP